MLSINLEEFLAVLERYNLTIWPLQIITFLLGIIALFFSLRRKKYSDQIILAILSFYWLWNGIVFCPFYWAPIYKYAYLFGVFCIIQGLLFLIGVFRPNISFGHYNNLHSIIGILFIIYAMVGYQISGYFLGHIYPKYFPFGLVPCPTTVYTFGIFLITSKKFPKYYLIVPLIVAIAGFLAVYIGVLEDIGLIIAGLIGTYLLLRRFSKVN